VTSTVARVITTVFGACAIAEVMNKNVKHAAKIILVTDCLISVSYSLSGSTFLKQALSIQRNAESANVEKYSKVTHGTKNN
jgi:hypothetical protein